MRRYRIVYALGERLWLIPPVGIAAAAALLFATVALDRRYHGTIPQSLVGTAAAAQPILTTIASWVVPLTTTVLTVTLVAVQLAMG
jgi:uncharacterized membrane protein